MYSSLYRPALKRLRLLSKSIWFFPALLIICLAVLSAFRISGSSIGVYPMIEGYTKDTHALYAKPRGVRSDEWLVNTQMTVAQANDGFRRINDNVANGQDMSLIVDVPYKDWSAIFKPQNLAFFVMPLENAFAFKWWLLEVALILACYFLALELFPRKILRSALLSIFVGLSPMVFWWYQTVTILTLAYGFMIILLCIKLLKANSRGLRAAESLLLSYILICFGLLLYPPFQIPVLLASAVFVLGWILDNNKRGQRFKPVLSLWPYIVLILATVAIIGGEFYMTRRTAIHTIENTVYPGTRVVTAGGTTPLLSFSSFLSPNLEYDQKAASGYLGNQSEASNFIFIAPFLVIPSIYLIVREKRRGKALMWGLRLTNILILVLLFRMYIYVSWLEPFYKIFFLQKVPNTRMLLGVGFAGVLQLMLLMRAMDGRKLSRREITWGSYLIGAGSLISMLIVGLYTTHHYPVFIANMFKVLAFAVFVTAGVILILQKRFVLGLLTLAAFSFLSVYKADPLYRGLDPLTKSPITQAIKAYPNNGNWVVLDNRLFINFPLMAGKHSLNSVDYYPQLSLWKELDPQNKYSFVYNRYAHVVFSDDPNLAQPFKLQYADMFYVKFSPCQPFLQSNARYVLSPNKLSSACLTFKQTVSLPAEDFFIYQIAPFSPASGNT